MKRILPLALFMFILTASIGWAITWWSQARQMEAFIEANLKSMPPAIGSPKIASIETTGFPTKMVVTIKDPSVTLNMKETLKWLDKYASAKAGDSAGVLTTPTYREGTLSYDLKGTLTLTMNALSNAMDMTFDGTATTHLVNEQDNLTFAIEYMGVNRCHLKLQRNFMGLLLQAWDVRPFLSEQFTENLKELTCDLPGSITMNASNNQIASSMGPLALSVKNDLVGEQAHLDIRLSVTDHEVMPAGDEVMNAVRRAMTPADAAFSPVSMSLYGKQSFNGEMHLEMAKDRAKIASQPLRLDMKRYSFTNAAMKSEGSALFSMVPAGTQLSGEVAVKGTTAFTARQGEIARANISQITQNIIDNENARNARAGQPEVTVADRQGLSNAIYAALPNVSGLGTISSNISFSYTMDKAQRTGNVNISALEVTTQQHGLTASGQATLAPNQMLPTASANVTCRNCLNLIDVVSAYLLRVEAAMVLLSPANAGQIAIDPADIHGLKGFLTALGKAAGNDLAFNITSSSGAVDVNGSSLAQIMMLMEQYFPKPAASAN